MSSALFFHHRLENIISAANGLIYRPSPKLEMAVMTPLRQFSFSYYKIIYPNGALTIGKTGISEHQFVAEGEALRFIFTGCTHYFQRFLKSNLF